MKGEQRRRDQIVSLFLATIIERRALSIVPEITGRRGGG
jgi:hypothetical protein